MRKFLITHIGGIFLKHTWGGGPRKSYKYFIRGEIFIRGADNFCGDILRDQEAEIKRA